MMPGAGLRQGGACNSQDSGLSKETSGLNDSLIIDKAARMPPVAFYCPAGAIEQ
jgi:hypothetical protein